MTNIFYSATSITIPAANRVFSVVTDLALWSAQNSGFRPANVNEATVMINAHMRKIRMQSYSDGALIRW